MPEKEWTLFMSGTTYLKVAEAAKILGFESVEEMFFDYEITTVELMEDGKVVMGKNVVLGDILEGQPAARCDHPDHQKNALPRFPLTVYPMTTTQRWTVTNSSNEATLRQNAFQTIMAVGR